MSNPDNFDGVAYSSKVKIRHAFVSLSTPWDLHRGNITAKLRSLSQGLAGKNLCRLHRICVDRGCE
jgi:hypothetical protein